MNYLVLHNKPKAEVHPGHMRTGPKEEEKEEEEEEEEGQCIVIYFYSKTN